MSRDSVIDVLFAMRRKGVKIWTEDGQLRYRAARGVLSPEEINKLRSLRGEIIDLIHQSSHDDSNELPPGPRRCSDPALPLAFSQLWWWNGLELHKRPSLRMITAAMRFSGRLNIEALGKSVTELLRRHESLRTRVVAVNGIPSQHIDEPRHYLPEVMDLTALPKSDHEIQVRQQAEHLINEPFFVASGPLFSARLLKLQKYEHVLVIALDHIISDSASLGIVWRELLAMYAQAARGLPCSLAKTSIQFGDYAVWQHETHQRWETKHASYWTGRLVGAERLRLPSKEKMEQVSGKVWATRPIEFGSALSTRLSELSRRNRTTTVMSALTAYVASLSRVFNKTDVAIPFTTVGRPHPEVENTIGFFATPMILRTQLHKGDSLLDLLERITKEYGTAYEHNDSCRMAARTPSYEVMWNPSFNWIPQEFDAGDAHNWRLDDSLEVERFRLDPAIRDNGDWGGELGLLLSDSKDGIMGSIRYRTERVPSSTIKLLEQSLQFFAEKLVNEPQARAAV